ncbi:DUF1801 domain-containing protein [Pseudohalocynthiibacter aestuariivivens]|nr:DUF1801 domain-containing protein [Pseudohalocynthiibacter aestuariivivens]QIE45449.1 DUF1801 domain-containing protein [Pseudohalocynthiibacter aestuariivivens]
MTDAVPPDVACVIDAYAPEVRAGVSHLRALIYDVAANLPQNVTINETLKWGQPAYRPRTGGTTLRLGPHRDACFALFGHCQSTVITAYAQAFPGWDRLDGNRAVLFDTLEQIEPERLSHLIAHALTYHQKPQ